MKTNKKRIVLPGRNYFFKVVTRSLPYNVFVELHDRKKREVYAASRGNSIYDYDYNDPYPRHRTKIGAITLDLELAKQPGKRPVHICCKTHSTLSNLYHNKGLGTLMYAKAIQWGLKHKYIVRSSGSSSSMAQRVWKSKSLKSYFKIKKLSARYSPTWQAYAK